KRRTGLLSQELSGVGGSAGHREAAHDLRVQRRVVLLACGSKQLLRRRVEQLGKMLALHQLGEHPFRFEARRDKADRLLPVSLLRDGDERIFRRIKDFAQQAQRIVGVVERLLLASQLDLRTDLAIDNERTGILKRFGGVEWDEQRGEKRNSDDAMKNWHVK